MGFRPRTFRSVLLAALALPFALPAQAAEPVTLRAGWANTPASLTPIIGLTPLGMKHQGESYRLEPVRFAGTSPEITALAAGELDIATLAYSSLAAAIENAGMTDLRIICDGFQDGVPGYYSSQYLVRRDSPIRRVEDLKGKVLVSNAIGGAVDIGLRDMARRHGLEDGRDFSIIEAKFPTMLPMLEDGKADLVATVPPFANMALASGKARVLFTLADAFGKTDMIFEVARQGFIAKHRAALVDFTEDWLRALRWYIDPAHHDQAVRIVSGYTKLKPAVFAGWVFTRNDYYRDPSGRPDLAALQRNIAAQHQFGFLKRDISVANYADLSLLAAAAKRLE